MQIIDPKYLHVLLYYTNSGIYIYKLTVGFVVVGHGRREK